MTPKRYRLPTTRQSLTHKVTITDELGGEHEIYLMVGLYDNGKPGELFVKTGKWGGTLNGLLDTIGIQTSLLLQYRVSLKRIASKMRGMAFEPSGRTDNPDIPECSSVVDYIFRWMESKFGE
ncbi:hypothetical protein LCGC14_3124230 [marine sediment metagenome]|uniref:ribonucleoside-diphosphate reductase n=1 Tax=marine sediment metagenome TaxID=412755 RepID=A0A0F8YR69_9ZZZZ